jgi:alpha-L-fucosidase 2
MQLAVIEMLVQSYSGTIRVFPAVPPDWEGQFRLHAVGRFVVSAARKSGDVAYVVIESKGGEPCRIANPWPGQSLELYKQDAGWTHVASLKGEILTFNTEPAGVYLLLPANRQPADLAVAKISGEPNKGAKALGVATLGMPRGF